MATPEDSDPLDRALRRLGGSVLDAIGELAVPIWVADALGRVRWMNVAATSLLGPGKGAHFSRFVASDSATAAREVFARTVHGRRGSTVQRVLLNAIAGGIAAEVASVAVRDADHVLGVISLVRHVGAADRRRPQPRLTPRQQQVLELLAGGCSTAEIADALQISEDTVRNHVRHLLAELRVRTRLEAVVIAFRNGWL